MGNNKNERVKFRENLAYALGGGSINFITVATTSALLVYYTYVVGISAGVAAGVMGASRIFDGISDIIMGRIVDRTHSKYGKARPWLIRMMIPMSISIVACFWVPKSWGTMAQAIYMFITYNLATTVCGTALGVANGALNGFMTLEAKSRGTNGALTMLANTVSNMIFAATYLRLANFFGGGEQYSQRGWTLTLIVYAIAYIPFMLIAFLGTKERVNMEEQGETQTIEEKKEEVSALESLKMLVKNKYWIIALITGFLIYFVMVISGTVMVYFCDYILGDVNLQASLNNVYNLASLIGILISMPFMGKVGKRIPIVGGMLAYAVGSIIPIFNLNFTTCMVTMAIRGLGVGISVAPMGSFVHDALTYGIWKYNVNCTGIGSSAITMASKVGQALSTVIAGALLEIGGFVAGATIQGASALNMINVMFIWLPIAFSIVIILVMIPYDLDKKYPQIVKELDEREKNK